MAILGAINHYLYQCMCIGIILFICLEGIQFIFLKKRKRIFSYMASYIFYTYIVAVCILTDALGFVSEGASMYFMTPNLVPVVETVKSLHSNYPVASEQIFLNIMLFLPFGLLVPLTLEYVKWNYKRITVVTVLTVCVIEYLEGLSGRFADIDDVIINTVGSLLGFTIYCVLAKLEAMVSNLDKKKNEVSE